MTNKYIYCNNYNDYGIHIYSIPEEKEVFIMNNHRGTVKDIKSHKTKREILSVSFDHSLMCFGRN
jgi:hypothetical protein